VLFLVLPMPNTDHGRRWYWTEWIQLAVCAVMCTFSLVTACIAAPARNTVLAAAAIGMTLVWGYFVIGYLRAASPSARPASPQAGAAVAATPLTC
jgi:hypothetical protein